jgi:hypothetical protein
VDESKALPPSAVRNTLNNICQNSLLRSYISVISPDSGQFSSSNSAPV